MSSKGKIRKKKHLKQRLRRVGACLTCAPMLQFKQDTCGGKYNEVPCPSCGRAMSFYYNVNDERSDAVIECLLRCFASSGQFCMKAFWIIWDGRTVAEGELCECDLNHIVLNILFPEEQGGALQAASAEGVPYVSAEETSARL